MKESHENIVSNFDDKKLYQIENMSLENTKEKVQWRKRAFEWKLENSDGIENHNDILRIHDDEVNKTAEWNLLHDIINSLKHTKI